MYELPQLQYICKLPEFKQEDGLFVNATAILFKGLIAIFMLNLLIKVPILSKSHVHKNILVVGSVTSVRFYGFLVRVFNVMSVLSFCCKIVFI